MNGQPDVVERAVALMCNLLIAATAIHLSWWFVELFVHG